MYYIINCQKEVIIEYLSHLCLLSKYSYNRFGYCNCTQTTSQTCTDYDSGNNILVASYGKNSTHILPDYCISQNYIIEAICVNNKLSEMLPPQYCPSGMTCKVVRYDPAINANVSACVNETTPNADLIVSDIIFTPSNPTALDLILINVTVKNIGTGTAGNSVLRVVYPGGYVNSLPINTLAPGSSYTWQITSYLAVGTHTYTATADADNTVTEPNENNNVLSKSVTVASTCTEVNKLVDFENPPHLSFHLTWNPDLGTQSSYNYNLDETARNWLRAQGIEITGTPNGIVWGTGISGPVGKTGVIIGFASPSFAETHEGISDTEVLIVRFLNNSVKSAVLGLTTTPSDSSLINNVPSTVILEAYNGAGTLVASATKTFTGVTNGVYTPTTMNVSSSSFNIAKITLRTTQHPYGGVWLEDISFKVPCS